nr:uncharacterized protein LOC117684217 [Crassostrea gigas]
MRKERNVTTLLWTTRGQVAAMSCDPKRTEELEKSIADLTAQLNPKFCTAKVLGNVNDKSASMLIDTGSSVTIVSDKFADQGTMAPAGGGSIGQTGPQVKIYAFSPLVLKLLYWRPLSSYFFLIFLIRNISRETRSTRTPWTEGRKGGQGNEGLPGYDGAPGPKGDRGPRVYLVPLQMVPRNSWSSLGESPENLGLRVYRETRANPDPRETRDPGLTVYLDQLDHL